MKFLFILRTTVLSTKSFDIPLTLGRENRVCCFGGQKIPDFETKGVWPVPSREDTTGMGRERESWLRERDGSYKRSRNCSRELRERTLLDLRQHFQSGPSRKVEGEGTGTLCWILRGNKINNLVPRDYKVIAKTIFERLHLVSGLQKFVPRFNCPYAPTSPPLNGRLFLDFRAIFLASAAHFFLVSTIRQVIWPSPSTLLRGLDEGTGLPIRDNAGGHNNCVLLCLPVFLSLCRVCIFSFLPVCLSVFCFSWFQNIHPYEWCCTRHIVDMTLFVPSITSKNPFLCVYTPLTYTQYFHTYVYLYSHPDK